MAIKKEEVKKGAGRPIIIKDEGDRKRKYAASITPNQYAEMTELFPKRNDSSSFEQVVTYAVSLKKKELSKKVKK